MGNSFLRLETGFNQGFACGGRNNKIWNQTLSGDSKSGWSLDYAVSISETIFDKEQALFHVGNSCHTVVFFLAPMESGLRRGFDQFEIVAAPSIVVPVGDMSPWRIDDRVEYRLV